MTNKQSHKDGTISKHEINWLTRRAKDGFGMVTTAAANVSKDGQGWEGEIGVFSDHQIDGLKRLTKNIKILGSTSIAQLFHGGMRSPQKITGVIKTVGRIHHTHSGFVGGFTTNTAVTTAIVAPIIFVKCFAILSLPIAVWFLKV